MSKKRTLLPTTFRPTAYKLTIAPDLEKDIFVGEEIVDLVVNQESSEITLHCLDIQIHQDSVTIEEYPNVKCSEITYDTKLQTATIKLSSKLQKGKVTLKMRFTGILQDKLHGFYRSSYKYNGKVYKLATTQFEPTDARRCFPCWDEPNIKATFEVTLKVPKDKTALSNMNVISEKIDPNNSDLKIVEYAKSPIMSTYLVAFIVGDFEYIEGKTKENVLVRIYTPLGKKDKGKFALSVATRALSYYTDFFGIAYPLPKMDLIAIPDFSAGAMENWGCITYRENRLLIDEKQSSAATKQAAARTICHEIAHQWFGNLVTMDWWTHLWLNEGFARYVEHLAVDVLFPEWDIWTQFMCNVYGTALRLDSLKNTHAIEIEVYDPSEIDEIFDSISYAKGGSVIRLIAQYIGMDALKKGLHSYLTKFSYKNTITEDLWQSLEEAAKKPVKSVMDTWTKQEGYPVVTVSEKQSDKGIVLTFSQERFLASGPDKSITTLWQIPITIKTQNSKELTTFVMKDKETSITIDAKPDEWIKINWGQAGFYRTRYSPSLLKKLEKPIASQEIPAADRLCIIGDAFALCRAGMIDCSDFLELVKIYHKEPHYSVWDQISTCFSFFDATLAEEKFYPEFQKFTSQIFGPLLDRLGWDAKDNESHLDSMFRALAINRLAAANNPAAIQEAQRRFQKYIEPGSKYKIAPDLRFPIYKMVVKNGGEKEFNQIVELYRKTDMAEEKQRTLAALCYAEDENLIHKALDFALSNEVRPQDIYIPIAHSSMNPKARNIQWKRLTQNWKEFVEKYGSGTMMLSLLVEYLTSSFTTFEKADEVEKFFEKNPTPVTRTVAQSLEKIRLKAAFLKREHETHNIENWLK